MVDQPLPFHRSAPPKEPPATQNDVDGHDIVDSDGLLPPGFVLGTIDHELPFHDSTRLAVPLPLEPAAMQNEVLTHETPLSWVPPGVRLRLGTTDHDGVALAATAAGLIPGTGARAGAMVANPVSARTAPPALASLPA